MQEGAIVEFVSSSEHRLGVITGEVGKQKLIVTGLGGVQMRPARADVTFITGKKADHTSAPLMQRALESMEAQIEALRQNLELELLWEMVLELGEQMDDSAMADLALGSTEAVARLAILRSLRADGVFFKQRKNGFEPRERAQVDQLREQLESQRRREQERANFLEAVSGLMALAQDERLAATQARLAQDTTFRQYFDVLREYAAQGDDYARRDLAEDFLAILGEDVNLRGRGASRAFGLMVALGLWTKHENLWLHRFHINAHFKPEVLAQAQAVVEAEFTPEPWRQSLDGLLSFTIDDDSTKDLDDALSIEQRERGPYVGIHIADPSALVPAGSALELEALSRGTSLYLPTGNTPMFPSTLSEGAMSLIAGQARPALSTFIQLSPAGEVLDVEVKPTIITVSHRLSYDQVDALLEGQGDEHPCAASCAALYEVAGHLARRRAEAGAISLSFPEVKFYVEDERSDEPEVSCQLLDVNTKSRELVSELMILASASIGAFCAKNNIPVIYRIQEPPEGEVFDAQTMALPEGLVRDSALRRKLRPASISANPGGHAGLGVYAYVQATSPIRRFSDYLCQRQLKAYLSGEPLPYDQDEILRIAAMVENTTREARVTERETVRYWTLYYLEQHQHEPMEAVVVDYRDDGKAFVFISALAFRDKVELRQRVPLGEQVFVKAIKASARQDMLRLVQAKAPGQAEGEDATAADDDAALAEEEAQRPEAEDSAAPTE